MSQAANHLSERAQTVYVYDRVAEVKAFAGDLRETLHAMELEAIRAGAAFALAELVDTALIRMAALDELLACLEPQPAVLTGYGDSIGPATRRVVALM